MSKKKKIIIASVICIAVAGICCAIFIPLSMKKNRNNQSNKYELKAAEADNINFVYHTGDNPETHPDSYAIVKKNISIQPIESNVQSLIDMIDKSKNSISAGLDGYGKRYTLKLEFGNSVMLIDIYNSNYYFLTYIEDNTLEKKNELYYEFYNSSVEDIDIITAYLDTLIAE